MTAPIHTDNRSDVRSADRIRAWSVLALAVGQIVTTAAPLMFGFSETIPSRAEAVEHALVPATYAFSIWSLIYLGALVFAVWQVLPGNLAGSLARRVGWLAAAMYAINTVWQIWVPALGLDWVSAVLLAGEAALGIVALGRLRDFHRELTGFERWGVAAPLSLLTGWVSAASFVGLSSTLVATGSTLVDPRQPPVAAALLSGAIVFCAFAVNATRSWIQAAGIVWALVAIVLANLLRAPEPMLVLLASGGVGLVLLARAAPWISGPRSLPAPA
jgi:hypothetical protein